MRDIKMIIFDWDGTVVDSIDRIVHVAQKACDEIGHATLDREKIRPFIGLPIGKFIAALLPEESEEKRNSFFLAYRHWWREPSVPQSQPIAGIRDLFERLKRKDYLLAVATGKSRMSLDREMDLHQFRSYFRASRCANETKPKPDPSMLNEIIEPLGLNPKNTVVIGDSEFDIKMAHNAGAHSIGVASGCLRADELALHKPNFVLPNATHVLDLLP